MLLRKMALCALVGIIAGCGPEISIPDEADDLIGKNGSNGKADTGYLSTIATEVDTTLTGEILLPEDDPDAEHFADKPDYQSASIVTKQIKFGLNQLKEQGLHLNLTANHHDMDMSSAVADQKIRAEYAIKMETILPNKDLQEKFGVNDPAQLKDRSYQIRVPADPRKMFDRYGDKCAEGFDEGSLENFNYFYYFAPDKEGCEAPTVTMTVTLNNPVAGANPYPEYDRLVEDNKVETVVFFGAAGYAAEVPYNDEGLKEWREFVAALESRGFRNEGAADADSGKGRHYKRVRSGLTETVDVISPHDLKALKNDSDGLFVRMVKSHEIIFYMGHSFYGSLSVLGKEETYPKDKYQIFLIGSCWSYEYYTKPIFGAKMSEADPKGWDNADVVNDTEAGWFMNNAEFSRILLTNLLHGAEHAGRDGDRFFHWRAIIDAMNKHAIARYEQYQSWWGDLTNVKHYEIMGVSGVSTNKFDPNKREEKKFEAEGSVARDQMERYTVNVGASAQRIKVTLTPADGSTSSEDADLYVLFNEAPSKSSYDCRPFDWGSNEVCDFEVSKGEKIEIMVHGWANTDSKYKLQVTWE